MANASYEQLLFNAIKNGQNTVKSVYDIWLELGNTGTPQDFLDSLKGEAATRVNGVTITAASWVSSEGMYKVIISDEQITADNIVNVNFTTVNEAVNSGVVGYTNSIDGGFEIYSNFQPTVDLVIDYSII